PTGVGVNGGAGHPSNAAETAASSSSTVTVPSPLPSRLEQSPMLAAPRAMVAPTCSSSTVTWPLPSQSPPHSAAPGARQPTRTMATIVTQPTLRWRAGGRKSILCPRDASVVQDVTHGGQQLASPQRLGKVRVGAQATHERGGFVLGAPAQHHDFRAWAWAS